MGYDYRGKKNDSTYCRPITGKGPVCVPIGNRRFSQVFNINDLLESQTMDNFWERYGNMDIFSTYRYIPVRYHWINLKPMLNQGSLEFRIFNKSLNPNYLWAVIELCKHFVLFAIETSFSLADFPVNSIYNPFTRGSIIETYNEFKSIAKIPEDADKVLLKIMEESDIESIVLPEEYIFTHLLSARSDTPSHFGGTYTPTVINKNLIKYPEYVDSHNFDRVMRTRDNSREEELIDPHVPRPVTLRVTPILNSDWAFFTDVPPPRNNNNNGEESTPSIVEEMEEIFEDEYDEENYEEE